MSSLTQIRLSQRGECMFYQRCLLLSSPLQSPQTCSRNAKKPFDRRSETESLRTNLVGSSLHRILATYLLFLGCFSKLLGAEESVRAILLNWHILDWTVTNPAGLKFCHEWSRRKPPYWNILFVCVTAGYFARTTILCSVGTSVGYHGAGALSIGQVISKKPGQEIKRNGKKYRKFGYPLQSGPEVPQIPEQP